MDNKIQVNCYHDSGIFTNGKIISFRIRNDDELYKSNKTFTCYGKYYQGIKWKNNFKEIFSDNDSEIYSVIDNKNKVYKIGDYAPDHFKEDSVKITKFYITDNYIRYKGIKMVESGGSI